MLVVFPVSNFKFRHPELGKKCMPFFKKSKTGKWKMPFFYSILFEFEVYYLKSAMVSDLNRTRAVQRYTKHSSFIRFNRAKWIRMQPSMVSRPRLYRTRMRNYLTTRDGLIKKLLRQNLKKRRNPWQPRTNAVQLCPTSKFRIERLK